MRYMLYGALILFLVGLFFGQKYLKDSAEDTPAPTPTTADEIYQAQVEADGPMSLQANAYFEAYRRFNDCDKRRVECSNDEHAARKHAMERAGRELVACHLAADCTYIRTTQGKVDPFE